MRKSATRLGELYGLNGQEMNQLLKNKGMLTGSPGDWSPTEKGKAYLEQNLNFAGPSRQNGEWTEFSWDETILDELDITEQDIEEAKEAAKEARKEREEQKREKEEAYEREQAEKEVAKAINDEKTEKIALGAIGVVGAVGLGYGVYKLWENRNRIKLKFILLKKRYFQKK